METVLRILGAIGGVAVIAVALLAGVYFALTANGHNPFM